MEGGGGFKIEVTKVYSYKNSLGIHEWHTL